MYWSVDENVVNSNSQDPNPVFFLEAMVQYSLIVFKLTLWNITATNEMTVLAPFYRWNNEVKREVKWQLLANSSTSSWVIFFITLTTDNCVYLSSVWAAAILSSTKVRHLGIFVYLVLCYFPMPRTIPSTYPTKWIKNSPICNCVNIRSEWYFKGKGSYFPCVKFKIFSNTTAGLRLSGERRKPKRTAELHEVTMSLKPRA